MFTIYENYEIWRLIFLVYAKETGKTPHIIISPFQDQETINWLSKLETPKIEITELPVTKHGTISSEFDIQDNTCIVYLTAYNMYNGARNHLQKIYDKLEPYHIALFIDAPYKIYWDSVKEYCDGVWDPVKKYMYVVPQLIQDYGLKEYNPQYIDFPLKTEYIQPSILMDSAYLNKHEKAMNSYKSAYNKLLKIPGVNYIGFDPYVDMDYMITPTSIIVQADDSTIAKNNWTIYKKNWNSIIYVCIPLKIISKKK